jgi:hypothetical protein
MNPTVFWSFSILALFIWLVFRPFATAPWKILAFIMVVAAAGPAAAAVLKASSHAYPLKYDYVLQSLDQALGVTAFQIARLLTDRERRALLGIYEFLGAAMVAWYGVHLVMRGGQPRKVLYSYLLTYLVGGCLYGIVPAMGPRYAFGAAFPMGHPNVAPVPALLDGYPNAMPSLHVATALLFVQFSGRKRWLLSIAVLFLTGTVAATLALEHYVVDLVVAVPFACFAVEAAYGRVIRAMKYLGLVFAWLGLIRFESPELLHHPWALRLLAVFTVSLGVRAVAVQWMVSRKQIEEEAQSPSARALPVRPPTTSPPGTFD